MVLHNPGCLPAKHFNEKQNDYSKENLPHMLHYEAYELQQKNQDRQHDDAGWLWTLVIRRQDILQVRFLDVQGS